jgi:hypothetical protein
VTVLVICPAVVFGTKFGAAVLPTLRNAVVLGRTAKLVRLNALNISTPDCRLLDSPTAKTFFIPISVFTKDGPIR